LPKLKIADKTKTHLRKVNNEFLFFTKKEIIIKTKGSKPKKEFLPRISVSMIGNFQTTSGKK
jgi:hypothetical protein